MSSTTNGCIQRDIDDGTVINRSENKNSNVQLNCFSNAKYKNQIMEKYLRGLDETKSQPNRCGMELSKWLESAAKFTPEKNNYIEWDSKR